MKQMLTEVVDRGRKLYSVDESCSVDRERKQGGVSFERNCGDTSVGE